MNFVYIFLDTLFVLISFATEDVKIIYVIKKLINKNLSDEIYTSNALIFNLYFFSFVEKKKI